jgi:hypothetical protein
MGNKKFEIKEIIYFIYATKKIPIIPHTTYTTYSLRPEI